MKHESIIELARKEGITFTKNPKTGLLDVSCDELELAYFAEKLISAEREACAKICDDQHTHARISLGAGRADTCAKFIRSRGNTYLYTFRRESADSVVSTQ